MHKYKTSYEASRRYEESEKGRLKRSLWNSSPAGKAAKRKYKKSEKAKQAKKRRILAERIQCPAWADKSQIVSKYLLCPEGYQVDHIIPLQSKIVCGLHIAANLQYLKKEENIKKGNRI